MAKPKTSPETIDYHTIRETGGSNSGAVLGGIGTGGVELWPDGRFHEWNIANGRPWAMWTENPRQGDTRHSIPPIEAEVGDTDFILRVAQPGRRPVYRWLFTGHGRTLTTASHFWRHHKYFFIKSCEAIEYRAEYPFIQLEYRDEALPVTVGLRAWTPFVPRDVPASAIPGFHLDFTVTNRGRQPVEVSIVWQMRNFAGYAAPENRQRHTLLEHGRARLVRMEGSLAEPGHDSSGCLTMWADPRRGQTVTAVAANPYLQNLIWSIHRTGGLAGELMPPRLAREEMVETPRPNAPNKGWLCLQGRLAPREEGEFRLGLAWFFPHHRSVRGTRVGHAYENWYADSPAVARALLDQRERHLRASLRLPGLLLESSLPEAFKLSLLDQLNTLVKSTHFIQDGRFGLQEGHGCCAFNTMDVDHYSSYALSLLQPALRAKVVEMHTAMAHPRNGKMYHGWPGTVEDIPLTAETVDGYNRWDCCCQYVLQVYRDAKWSGNRALLEQAWPAVRRTMDLVASMDYYEVGLPYIEGGITYDHWRMKGIVGYMAALYLAALRAQEDMAELLGEAEAAQVARDRFHRGRESFERLFWSGSQYFLYYARFPQGQVRTYEREGHEGHLDPQRPEFTGTAPAEGQGCCGGAGCCERPVAMEEVRDEGVMTDLLNGHATAAVLGLGGFLDPRRVERQLRLVLERNVQPENDSLVNGTYPDGHFLDEWPFMQWQTPWTGSEYFFALQCYAAGLVAEGDAVVEMVLRRHLREGMRFDHAECNNHYARPLCLWGAFAMRLGLDYDGWRGHLALAPREDSYEGLFLTAPALGTLRYSRTARGVSAEIRLEDGSLTLRTLSLGLPPGRPTVSGRVRVTLAGKALPAVVAVAEGTLRLTLRKPVVLRPGRALRISS